MLFSHAISYTSELFCSTSTSSHWHGYKKSRKYCGLGLLKGVKDTAKLLGGECGGKPDLAQSWGPDAAKLEEALAAGREAMRTGWRTIACFCIFEDSRWSYSAWTARIKSVRQIAPENLNCQSQIPCGSNAGLFSLLWKSEKILNLASASGAHRENGLP